MAMSEEQRLDGRIELLRGYIEFCEKGEHKGITATFKSGRPPMRVTLPTLRRMLEIELERRGN